MLPWRNLTRQWEAPKCERTSHYLTVNGILAFVAENPYSQMWVAAYRVRARISDYPGFRIESGVSEGGVSKGRGG